MSNRFKRLVIVELPCLSLFGAIVLGCGSAYRSPELVKGRFLSQHTFTEEEYRIYSAALTQFMPDSKEGWISVTGVTIPAEHIEDSVFGEEHRDVVRPLANQLEASSDTVYVITNRFSETHAVATVPVIDTVNWVPVLWHRDMHRQYPAGLISLSKIALDSDHQWALVYGLSGHGPVGTGFARVVLLHRESGAWKVVASRKT